MTAPLPTPVKFDLRDGVLEFRPRSLVSSDVAVLWPLLEAGAFPGAGTRSVRIDLADLDPVDSSGVVLIAAMRRRCRAANLPCDLQGASSEFLTLLAGTEKEPEPRRQSGTVRAHQSLKQTVYALEHEWLRAIQEAFSFCGEVAMVLAVSVRQPHLIRWRQTLVSFECASVNALGIVSLVCFLTGIILAFQGANLLRPYGTETLVPLSVSLLVCRELGPLMVAFVCIGRSGAAYAAEIGTMKVSEEVGAMETMGLSPVRFLVIPKLLAMTVALPCLTILGDLVALAGGAIICRLVLDMPFDVYWDLLFKGTDAKHVYGGLIKSLAFAPMIALTGCYYGFRTGNSSQSVGSMTTRTVVVCILLIIIIDTVFTVFYNRMGI
jgi:phospholipid/cholesterol/gamma-HCH transport system permease protein